MRHSSIAFAPAGGYGVFNLFEKSPARHIEVHCAKLQGAAQSRML